MMILRVPWSIIVCVDDNSTLSEFDDVQNTILAPVYALATDLRRLALQEELTQLQPSK